MTVPNIIVFDWNGTLFDDIDALVDCFNIILKKNNRAAIDLATYQTHYTVPFTQLYRNHGFSEDDITRASAFSQDVFHDHYEPMAAVAGLRPGAVEILKEAQDHKIDALILSNHLVDPIKTQLNRLGITDLFKDVLAYADRGSQFKDMTKGERLKHYLAAKNLTAAKGLIVGDSVEEIEIGRELNLTSVALTGGCVSEARLATARPDYIIHRLNELSPILRQEGLAA